jgi:hypothetical protein
MTPESQNIVLLSNGLITHVPASTNQSTASQRFCKHLPVTIDRMTTKYSRWWSLFGSPEVIKGRIREIAREQDSSSFAESERIPRSAVVIQS